MENNVFETIDKSGRKIRLTKKQWEHITVEHPDVTQEEIKLTIQNPLKIIEKTNERYFYYQYFKYKKSPTNYLRVIVKYLNGGGYVITAYFVKDIR
ncbi:hypothetical protein HY212_05085 [Candidatus Pacearchaeota archaeon]|nr:hypothetical protein [Candidatus Pacearchaeota archaeon]